MTEHTCPHCGAVIDDDEALMCLYCGEDLERPVGTLGKMRYSTHWAIVASVVLVIIFFILVFVVR